MKVKISFISSLTIALLISKGNGQSQNLTDYRVDEGYGRCYYCLWSQPLTLYAVEKPVCEYQYGGFLIKPEQLQGIEKDECYDFRQEDLYYYEADRYCEGEVHDFIDCPKSCDFDPETNYMLRGQRYFVDADHRCIYKVPTADKARELTGTSSSSPYQISLKHTFDELKFFTNTTMF